MIEETKDTAANSLEELFNQSNQMDNIDNELSSMDSEMDRSMKVYTYYYFYLNVIAIKTFSNENDDFKNYNSFDYYCGISCSSCVDCCCCNKEKRY